VALLLLLVSLFLFLGVGSGSNSTSDLPLGTNSSSSSSSSSAVATSTNCVVVTWQNGQPAHKHRCHRASSGGASVHSRAVVKCTARMTAGGQTRQRCLPPAKP
jgi:hypothetical protein